jgi:malonyl-CoA O-methyltransferase
MLKPSVPTLDKAQVRASFERAAVSYDSAAALQRRVADELIARLDFVKLAPRRILDVGSGTGYAARRIAKKYPRAEVVGLDLSLAMARRARRAKPWLTRRQSYLCADAEYLPFANQSFDLVISSLALQWCDAPTVYSEVARALAPQGLFVFSTFGPDTLRELRGAWQAVDQNVHVHEFADMPVVGDALVGLGFTDPVLDVERYRLPYEDAISLLREIKNLGAHNVARARPKGLTGKGHFARFKQIFESKREHGKIPVTYEVMFAHAFAPKPARFGNAAVTVSLEQLRRNK